MSRLSDLLVDPRLKNVKCDSNEMLEMHRAILQEKALMRGVFQEFYDECISLDRRHLSGVGLQVELGAGSGFFKAAYPEIISTDIKPAAHLDMVLDAQDMPFEPSTVRSIYGINCFHHFRKPEVFLSELVRVLVKGGGCILIEPHYGLVGRYFYRWLHSVESFDMNQEGWHFDTTRYGTIANQALAYIVFVRDRERFQRSFPELEIVYQGVADNYVRYLLSGGLNFRALLPDSFDGIMRLAESLLRPFHQSFGLHQTIVLKKVR